MKNLIEQLKCKFGGQSFVESTDKNTMDNNISAKTQPEGGNTLFYISFGIYLAYSILNMSLYSKFLVNASGVIFKLCFAIVGVYEVRKFSYKNNKELVLGLFFILVPLFYMYIVGGAEFAVIFAFIYSAREMDFKRIARFSILISSIALGFIIISSFLGVIPNPVFMHHGKLRYNLGFRGMLFAPLFLFNITTLVLYERGSKIKWMQILFLILLNVGMFFLTDSRLSFYLSLLILFADIMLKIFPNLLTCNKVIKVVCLVLSFSYIFVCIFSLYATIEYGNVAWLSKLDKLVDGRLRLGKEALMTFGISLLANKNTVWIGNGLDAMGNLPTGKYIYADNLYIHILLTYGVIFLVVYVILFTLVLFKCLKKKEHHLFIILVALAFRGFIDDLSFYLCYNTFVLLIGSMLISPKFPTNYSEP